MTFKILERIFLIFSNILLSLPFTIFGLSKFNQSEIKAYWQPPGYVFGVVWPILYCLFSVINVRTMISTNLSEGIKELIINQSLKEALLQTLWLAITSNYGTNRKFIQYILGGFVMIYLVYYCYLVRKPMLARTDPTSFYLYLPYTLWIVFASILNMQIVYKFYKLDSILF